MAFGGIQKLDVNPNDGVVLWDGDQIGFMEFSNTILLCVTDEDFENNEQSLTYKQDVLKNLSSIKVALTNAGYKLNIN